MSEEEAPIVQKEESKSPSPKIIPKIRIDPIVPASTKGKPMRPTNLDIPNPIRPASDVFKGGQLYRDALEQG